MADKVVLSYHDSLIRESDIKLLDGHYWLNDSLIAFWFEHLQHEVFNNSKFLFVGPEVTQLIKMGDIEELPIFLDPLDVHNKDTIFFPLNDSSCLGSSGGSHWSLLVYKRPENQWYHYDSQRGINYKSAKCLAQRVNRYFGNEDSPQIIDAYCTQQDNAYDCGAYVMLNAKCIGKLMDTGRHPETCLVDRLEASSMRDLIKCLIISRK